MNEYLLWLIIVVTAVILIPIAAAVIRNIDYKRQISGKRKVRTLKEGEQVKVEGGAPNMDMEILAAEAKMKSAQNVMGPGGLGG
ncbi:MAG TPA: hypothetical protein H9744_09895 [Candidatus Eisenbergiella stercoravium]|nr:hypothetical protein [Candidatus Eisenbergiella stercoravium]